MSEKPIKGGYLLELTLENVRCFSGPVTIDFRNDEGGWAQWSVIIGENGVGKTTVLRAIAGLCPDVTDAVDYAFERAAYSNVDFFGKQASRMVRNGKEFELLISAEFTLPELFPGVFPKEKGGFYSKMTSLTHYAFHHLEKGMSGYGGGSFLFQTYESMPCIGFGASRKMANSDLTQDRLADVSETLFDDEAFLSNVEELLLRIDYQHEANKDSMVAARQKARIEELLLKILPEVSQLRIVKRVADFGAEVQFQTPDGWVRLGDMSLGYKTLISWVVDLASKMFIIYKDRERPLEEPAIVLVDEIDLHMHPKWQREIMNYLSNIFKRTQFIVTAHSPLIVQAALGANLIMLKRVGDHVEVENDPIQVKNWRIDQILASDLFGVSSQPPETEKLLSERRAILAKEKRTAKDEKRLGELEERIGPMPIGETEQEIRAMEIIRKAAQELK